MARLALDGVTKRYGNVVALSDVTLSLPTSGFHCLLGPNGSGKTTAFRLLLGLERPSAGTVHRDGVRIGSGFQQPSFFPSLSVRENLAVFATDRDDGQWRDRLLDELRLRPALDRRAGALSGGFARKLDLALAFQDRPDVVLLDEPLGALDDVTQELLRSFLLSYSQSDGAVVVSTHRVGTFERCLDRLTVLHEGSVLYDRRRDDIDLRSEQSLQDRYVEIVHERARANAPGRSHGD